MAEEEKLTGVVVEPKANNNDWEGGFWAPVTEKARLRALNSQMVRGRADYVEA